MVNERDLKIGVALSGGGYRAAAFHLGTLRKLNKMNILGKVDVFSTVSGGSIVGAAYVLSLTNPGHSYAAFEKEFITKLGQSVIRRVLSSIHAISLLVLFITWLAAMIGFQFTDYPWLSWILVIAGIYLLISFQFELFPVSVIIEKIYDDIFLDKKKLVDLPDKPAIVINSTNLETGRQFSFSKNRMWDSTYDHPESGPPIFFKSSQFPVSRAVMASSCVPFAFTPVPIDASFFKNPTDINRARPFLVDGGVFDNQGIHKLTHKKSSYRCDIVITSDAGNKMPFEGFYGNVFTLLIRSMDLFMNRIKKFQIQANLYDPDFNTNREIAYISLGWDLDKLIDGFVNNIESGNIPIHVLEAHKFNPADLKPLNRQKIKTHLEITLGYAMLVNQLQSPESLKIGRSVGTNLTALSKLQIDSLINQAELMTELQIKLYCPSLL